MTKEFKTKYLLHVVQKQKDTGFTLIELLVVIMIIGLLSVIALPSFLSQSNKAKEIESKQFVGSMNRAQQSYFLEKATFSNDVGLLGMGIRTSTLNYTYTIQNTSKTATTNLSSPNNINTLKAHTGGVQAGVLSSGEATTLTILCQSNASQAGDPNGVSFSNGSAGALPSCSNNYSPL